MSDYPIPEAADFDLVKILRAVGDPIRLDIITALADGELHPKNADGWGAGVTKSTMSHHFRILREAGFIRTLVDGRTHACQLRRTELDERFPGLVEALTRDADDPAAGARRPLRSGGMTEYLARTPDPTSTTGPG